MSSQEEKTEAKEYEITVETEDVMDDPIAVEYCNTVEDVALIVKGIVDELFCKDSFRKKLENGEGYTIRFGLTQ